MEERAASSTYIGTRAVARARNAFITASEGSLAFPDLAGFFNAQAWRSRMTRLSGSCCRRALSTTASVCEPRSRTIDW
jgi:hypothetical protein